MNTFLILTFSTHLFRRLSTLYTSHTTLCYYHTRCLGVKFDLVRVFFHYLITTQCCTEASEDWQWMFLSRNEWNVFEHPASRGDWWTQSEYNIHWLQVEMKDVEERSGTQWHHHSHHPAQMASKGQERCNSVCVCCIFIPQPTFIILTPTPANLSYCPFAPSWK